MRAIFFFQIRESKEKERLEKRLLEELFKMFMDSDSFYYSLSYDLTNSVQRQSACEKTNLPLWRKVSGLCLFLPQTKLGMSCPIMVMVQIWLLTFYSSWAPCPVTSSAARKQNFAAAWPELRCFIKNIDLSVQVEWINWWTLVSFPQILPKPTCNTAKTALLSSKQVDDRFFWNKHMIEDLISIDVSLISNTWIMRAIL